MKKERVTVFPETCDDEVRSHKRKKVDDYVEASLTMIYHNGAEIIECHCKQLIKGSHICSKKISGGSFQIMDCGFNKYNQKNSCSICIMDAKEK